MNFFRARVIGILQELLEDGETVGIAVAQVVRDQID